MIMKNKKPQKKNSASNRHKGAADRSKPARRAHERVIKFSEDLVWGLNPIFEALSNEPSRLSEIIIQKEKRGSRLDDIFELARTHKVKISLVDSLRLSGDGSSGVKHQGLVAKVSQADLLEFSDFLSKFEAAVKAGEKPRIMVCDSLQDPHNLGAIIRSALASGASGVLITRERSAPLGGTAHKSSAGAISHIDICQVTNLASALADFKKAGAWIFGAIKDADAVSLYETDFNVPSCIVIGSEGKGIRPLVRRECDVLVSIPMVGKLDSLNASVAAAVILFEAMRQTGGVE